MSFRNYGFNQAGYSGYGNPNYNYYQKQEYMSKQKVSLVQDQKSSNTLMCRILSELENLAFLYLYQGTRIFGYYATVPNNYQDIVNQIIIQMKIFENSYKHFVKTNPGREYIFPNNLHPQDIERIVNDWKAHLIKKAKQTGEEKCINAIKYYDEFLNILSTGNTSYSFKNEFENLGNNSPPISANELRRVMNAGSTAVCYMNEDYDNIEQEIAKKGDYKVNVVLHGNRSDNKFYNHMDKYDQQLNNHKQQLYPTLYAMLGYLEKYAMLNSNRIKTPKYNKYIKINTNNVKKIEDEYFKYLSKFYDIYTSENVDFDLEPTELNEFVHDITYWKNNISDIKVKKEMDNAIKLLNRNYENLK